MAVCDVAGMACSLSGRPWPAYRLVGRGQGRTIPLADVQEVFLVRAATISFLARAAPGLRQRLRDIPHTFDEKLRDRTETATFKVKIATGLCRPGKLTGRALSIGLSSDLRGRGWDGRNKVAARQERGAHVRRSNNDGARGFQSASVEGVRDDGVDEASGFRQQPGLVHQFGQGDATPTRPRTPQPYRHDRRLGVKDFRVEMFVVHEFLIARDHEIDIPYFEFAG